VSATVTTNPRNTVHHAKNARTHPNPHVSANEPRRHNAREALARALEPATTNGVDFADDPRLAELLARHHLGLLPTREANRVGVLLRDNPPDVLARLERAAVHLHITGEHARELVDRAAELATTRLSDAGLAASRLSASHYPATPQPTAPRSEHADPV
jgi:hypothetical protein